MKINTQSLLTIFVVILLSSTLFANGVKDISKLNSTSLLNHTKLPPAVMAPAFKITKTWSGPAQSFTNTTGTNVSFVSFTAADIPAGMILKEVEVSINWTKSDDGTCTAITGIPPNLGEVGFALQSPINSQVIFAASNFLGPFLSTTSSWSGSTGGNFTTSFASKPYATSLLPATSPANGTYRTNGESLDFFNNTAAIGLWRLRAIDDAPSTGPALCVNSYSVTLSLVNTDDSFVLDYPSTNYTTNDTDPLPSITVSSTQGSSFTGGVFYEASGSLSIDSATGVVDLSNSTPGMYTIQYFDKGLTSSFTMTVVDAVEDASFSYPAAAYCATDTNPTPTITGDTGGTFSSTTGISLNTVTGVIDLAASTTGTYTVSYTTNGSAGSAASSNVSVTVSALDDASFSYAAASYCPSDNNPTPTITGLAGGSFSSTVGLSIDSMTGSVDLSNSTEGTYTITYTTNGTCTNTSTITLSVIDNTAPIPDATMLADVTATCEVTMLTAPTATDNCSATVTVTNDATLPITAQGTTVVTWTYNDGNGNTSTQTQNVVIDDVTPPTFTVTSATGTMSNPFTSLDKAALTFVPSGVYFFNFNNATFQGVLDNDTNGGGWLMVLNYVHQQNTNPDLVIRNTDLPLMGSSVLGSNEAATATWGHMGNALAQALDFDEIRFYGQTSGHNRIIDFSTSLTTAIDYVKNGTGSFSGINNASNYTLSTAHTSSIPQNAPDFFTNQGDLALTNFPFWRSGLRHWGIKGFGNRWEVDDFPNNSSLSTIHRVWVRANTTPFSDSITVQLDATGNASIATTDFNINGADNCSAVTSSLSQSTFDCSNLGDNIIQYTIADANGNNTVVNVNVSVEDVTAPVADLATLVDVTTECEVTALLAPTATDICSGTVTVTNDATLPITFQGTTVVTWSYDDGNGNISTQTQNVIIDDVTAPVITCPANILVTCSTVNGVLVNYEMPITSDNCAFTSSNTLAGYTSLGSFNGSDYYIADATFTPVAAYLDAASNGYNLVTINNQQENDYLASQLLIQGGGALIGYNDVNSENNFVWQSGSTSIYTNWSVGNPSNSFIAGSPPGEDYVVVATDGLWNDIPSNFSQRYLIEIPNGSPTQTAGLASGSTFPVGTTTNTFTVTDAAGNTSTCSFDVVVEQDIVAPVPDVATLADVTAECEVTSLTAPTATDNCSITVTVTNDAILPISTQGTTVVTWTYDDGNGNISTQTQNVILDDVTPPVIAGCPTNIIQSNDVGDCSAIVNYIPPTATDNCTSGGASNILFVSDNGDAGEIPNALTAQGYSVTSVFNDYVSGNNTALQGSLSAYSLIYWHASGSNGFGQVHNAATFTNLNTFVAGGGNVFVTGYDVVVSPVDSEMISFLGGTFGNDINPSNGTLIGPNNLTTGFANITGMTITAPNGDQDNINGLLPSVIVVLPGSASGGVEWGINDVPGGEIAWVSSGQFGGASFPSWSTPGSGYHEALLNFAFNSNGQNITQTAGLPSGSAFPVGTTTNTFTATDAAGNTSTCSFDVTITDSEAPTPDVAVLTDVTAECEVTMLTPPTATDNCATATVTVTNDATLPISTQGTTVVTWSYDDGNGNISTQTQNVIIDDVTAPTPDATTLADVTAECEVTSLTAPTATDNCSNAMVTITNDAMLPISTQGTTVVTWTYDDGNGNSTTQTQNVIIDDVTAPVLVNCPTNINVNNDTGDCSAVVTFTPPIFTDNCSTIQAPAGFTSLGNLNDTYYYISATPQTAVDAFTEANANGYNIVTVANQQTNSYLFNQIMSQGITNEVIIGYNDLMTEGTFVWQSGSAATYTNWGAGEPNNVGFGGEDYTVFATNGIWNDVNEMTVVRYIIELTDNVAVQQTAGLTSGSAFPVGTTTNTFSVTDLAGNTTTCSFDVIVSDAEAPTPDVAVLADVTAECEITSLTAPTATDNCSNATVTVTSDAMLPITAQGTTVVTWSYDDGNGNISTQTQNVILDDVTAPVVDAATLPDLVFNCVVTSLTPPTATDNCVGTVTGTATFPINTTRVVMWSFDDGNGNVTTQSQLVIIERRAIDAIANVTTCDTFTLPTITGDYLTGSQQYYTQSGGNGTAFAEATTLSFADFASYPVTLYAYDTDGAGCSTERSFTLTINATPVIAPIAAVTACDQYVLPALPVGNYFTFPGGNGNMVAAGTVITATQTLFVYATNGSCTDQESFTVNIQPLDNPAFNYSAATYCPNGTDPTPTVTGLAGGTFTSTTGLAINATTGAIDLDASILGSYVVTYTTNGNCPQSSTVNVTIEDNDAPVPTLAVLAAVTAQCEVTSLVAPTATDNCGGTVTVTSDAIFPITGEGTTTVVTWTYTDANGNTATQTQNVVIDDTTAPVATMAALPSLTFNCDVSSLTAPTATDNCVGTITATTSTTFPINATRTVTWTYDDGNGNVSTQTQLIVIERLAINAIANATQCDTFTLPNITGNFLTGAQQYYTQPGGNGTAFAEGTTLNFADFASYPVTLYAYDANSAGCSAQVAFQLTINNSPVVAPIADVTICDQYVLPALPVGNYFTFPGGNGTLISAGSVITASQTLFVYAQDPSGDCSDEESFVINITPSDITGATFDNANFTFNGTAQSIFVQNIPSTATVVYTNNGQTNAGTYVVTATITSANATCNTVIRTATMTIGRAAQTITFDPLTRRRLFVDPDFQINASASSGLPLTYTFSFTGASPAATVSATGFVTLLDQGEILITASQPGNGNFLPAQQVQRRLEVYLGDNADLDAITISGDVINNPGSEIYYLIDCDDSADFVDVELTNNDSATFNPGATFTINTPRPGIYRQQVIVTAENGMVTRTYNITVERRFQFDAIVEQKYNNVLVVNNNPANNGGYSFVAYEWFKNDRRVGTQQFFSEGDNATDVLDPTALYYVRMTTTTGEVLQTCVSTISLGNTFSLTVLENPVISGRKLNVRADYPTSELDNARYELYSASGQYLNTVRVDGVDTAIELSESLPVGMYRLVLITQARSQSVNFIKN